MRVYVCVIGVVWLLSSWDEVEEVSCGDEAMCGAYEAARCFGIYYMFMMESVRCELIWYQDAFIWQTCFIFI